MRSCQTSHLTRLFLLTFALSFAATGCTSIPPVRHADAITPSLLREHVTFLAQPALQGRAPRTDASAVAREYITSRLTAFGLKPWPAASGSFEQPFVIGTNVVAVLPGSDPELSKQLVLFTAHYDHLGEQSGKIYPGACDNASGVATLLETAQTLARRNPRPRRSIVFCFFDCEEMGCLGSLAFTSRSDFDARAVVAAVNIDMLGRRAFDLPGDSLVVGGSERYPLMRDAAQSACQSHALRLLPVGRDFIGPRSDHISFEGLGIPAVLLSCGPNRDYHRPTDTADKIDYDLLQRQAAASMDLTVALADADAAPQRVSPKTGDTIELTALLDLARQLQDSPKLAGLVDAQLPPLRELATEAQRLHDLGSAYTATQRQRFVADAQEKLLPVLTNQPISHDEAFGILLLSEIYALHTECFSHIQRAALAEVIARRPDFFHPFGTFKIEELAIDDNSVRLAPLPDGRFRLSLCVPLVRLALDLNRIGHGRIDLSANIVVLDDASGTRDELIDYALLRWIGGNPKAAPIWREALRQLTSKDHGDNPVAWQDALHRVPAGTTRGQWVLGLLHGENPALARAAVTVAAMSTKMSDPAFVDLLRDPATPLMLRYAILYSQPKMQPDLLATIKSLVPDTTPIDPKTIWPAYDESFPFYEQVTLRFVREYKDFLPPTTLGRTALQALRPYLKKK